MTTHQFFIKKSHIDPERIVKIDGSDAHHMRVVLRLKQNSIIHLMDEEKTLHVASVDRITEEAVYARILESTAKTDSRMLLTVIQGIPRLPKLDIATQKLAELGVNEVTLVPMRRTPYKNGFDRVSKRAERLEKIAESAAKQSARPDIPNISVYAALDDAVKSLDEGTLLLFADENIREARLRDVLLDISGEPSVAVVIGPEGGLSAEETESLKKMGAKGFSLGRNILRTETAAIVAAALILYELGEI